MKLWTLQKREILDKVLSNGYFQPDFSRSTYAQNADGLEGLYALLLEAFNRNHQSNFPGLVFAFAGTDNRHIYEFPDIVAFRECMTANRAAIDSLWKTLTASDTVILELEVSDDFNPFFIDINDFQHLMPPVIPCPPYDETDAMRLLEQLCSGQAMPSKYCSGIMQAHLPYISREDLVAAYEPFPLD